jgi:hypothetical protein
MAGAAFCSFKYNSSQKKQNTQAQLIEDFGRMKLNLT